MSSAFPLIDSLERERVTVKDRYCPKISIVTISYNQAGFIAECIESVLAQDYHNFEYIIVDPGSTDGSREIIARYSDRISLIVLDPDNGPADGLNKGFSLAFG
jgi:glycosyltransferase involved in cell wall biosynthesis